MMEATKMLKLAAASAVMMVAMGATPVQAAGTLTGTLDAQLLLMSGCVVTDQPGDFKTAEFGVLDFGSQLSSFTGSVDAIALNSAGGSPVTLTCTPNLSGVTMTIDSGANSASAAANGPGTRAMKIAGAGTDAMAYDVFTSSAHDVPYVAGTAMTITIPADGIAVPLPIFGHLNKTSTNALTAGTYADTLAVTIAW
jgi:spore coat protein U-like protein